MAVAHAEARTQANRPQESFGTGENARATGGGASFGTGEDAGEDARATSNAGAMADHRPH
jgi:hypothetical protein